MAIKDAAPRSRRSARAGVSEAEPGAPAPQQAGDPRAEDGPAQADGAQAGVAQADETQTGGTQTSGAQAGGAATEAMADPAPAASQQPPGSMLGLWTSWLDLMRGQVLSAGQAVPEGQPWQVRADEVAGRVLADSVRKVNDALLQDPNLRTLDRLLNANPLREVIPVDWAEVARALRTVWLRNLGRPGSAVQSALDLNLRLWRSALDAWSEAGRRWLGEETAAPATPGGKAPPVADKRFAAPEWQSNPLFRTLRDSYLIASEWLLKQGDAPDLDEAERLRLNFHLRQFIDATSPTLALASNPAALRRAMETGGASIASGIRNLLADVKAGRLSMVDATAFAPGRNLALSEGKVVYRNRLIELIQYAPRTETTHAVPLLMLPPWINKFYILDLQAKNSMVRHLLDRGFTVFMVSWKNPDASMDSIGIEDYMELGPLAASEVVGEITGARQVNVMGYCIGGTLLAMTLAWLAAKGDDRFNSATFMVSLQDFSRVGDTAVFMDEDTVDLVEQQMLERGYLDSRDMANMFNLLRPNDLIWVNVVNNYLMGDKPAAFDILYWNSDSTRMARAAHSWYLRNTYRENNLIVPGRVTLKGEPIDLGRITLDTYAVGAEKDHIVPWDAAWHITHLFGGDVRYVLASSGHVAGIINPPGGKGSYLVNESGTPAGTPTLWRQTASKREGSWWTDWFDWLGAHAGARGAPPPMGRPGEAPLADAPGTYVLER
ncbi:alpha/beta fold hydrolase [Roseomonas sp. NAR14]|uniref:Alpha/beta fold hydrolase n=1 Tax=Roseomonas acroporae TaxID=2937791 RepID=A0A9X1Y8B1_9PROT|nr:alpha/beta fold hydrolase [Roseomonas acroporae]MCK8783947.1 alpha/beta fold hydrolase [Roseomonas acroporae]